ncbi:alpha-galactosidase [Lacticaseibacillus paracasei]|uniref:Uncharacterized protein n=2 Tax=Lacticaseibacillus paracasei TaxID=1597 RepID=A0ABD6W0E4_LACPA|nr:hypothetical protein ACX51_08775 [Lacticaseibacillus paracasei]BBF74704.1 alpha-galactosidase [Lacticaseibacillus paracasei]GEK39290.1 hypothetical protein LCA02_09800 [Lacticaseibacillus casei]
MKGNLSLSYVDFEMREQAQKPAHKDLRQEWAKASRQCAGSETREQAQKPAHKDLKPKWPKPSYLGLRPLMFRFLTAPVRALSHFL